MRWVTEWVRDLVIIVFFVSVAYMLLPENNLRRYARLVLGLVVIVALLTPVMDLMRLDPSGFGSLHTEGNGSAETLIAQGQFIAAEAHQRLTGDGRVRSETHIASVVELALGAVPDRVDVRWLDDGEIGRITVIAADEDRGELDGERAARLIAGYFGLREELVDVRIRPGGDET